MQISKRVLAIILAALSAASLVTVALAFVPQARSLFGLKNNGSPDFTVTSSPSTTSVDAGASTTVSATFTSANGFSGTLSLTSTVNPSTGSAFTASPTPSSVTLSSGGTGSSTINLSTTSAVATGSYTVTVVGTTGTVSKSVSIAVRVLPVGSDFSISNPIGGIIVVSQGWSTQPGITVSGIGGFSGSISLTTTISPQPVTFPQSP